MRNGRRTASEGLGFTAGDEFAIKYSRPIAPASLRQSSPSQFCPKLIQRSEDWSIKWYVDEPHIHLIPPDASTNGNHLIAFSGYHEGHASVAVPETYR
jgi:hypothetical protein